MYIKEIKIGNIKLKNNIFTAPMAGITDFAFRKILNKFSPGLIFSEMVSVEGINYRNKKTLNLLKFDNETPLVLQIFGSDSNKINRAVEYLNDYDFAILDLNCGCPVKKIVSAGNGSYLLKDINKLYKIFTEMVHISNKPVTAKLRLGWDDSSINVTELSQAIEEAGVSAITLHPRTKTQNFSGKAKWEYIKKIKDKLSIPVIGNGDITTVSDAKNMFDQTDCDAIMIGRKLIGYPWFLEDIFNHLKGENILTERSTEYKMQIAVEQLDLMVEDKGERVAVKEFRKHLMRYSKGLANAKEFRSLICSIDDRDSLVSAINKI